MRDIKFRQALLKENNTFIKFHYWGILGDGGLTGKASGFKTGEDQQYTGLKDSQGTEIYEGDILKFNGGADDFFAEVGFEEGCFIAKMPWVKKG